MFYWNSVIYNGVLSWQGLLWKRDLKGLPREKRTSHTESHSLINSKKKKKKNLWCFPEPLNGLSLGEDLTLVQKMIIDTLHKEGQAKKVIAKSSKSSCSHRIASYVNS